MRKITLQFVLFNQSKFNIEHLVKAMKKLPVILIAADVEDMKVTLIK